MIVGIMMTQKNKQTIKNNPVEALAQDANFFRQLAEQLPCYVCVFDERGLLTYINPAMVKGIGAPDAAFLIGKFNLHDWHGEDFDSYKLPKKLQKALSGEIDFAINIPAPIHEGRYGYQTSVSRQFASVCAFPIKREDGCIHEVGILFFPHTIEYADPKVMRCRVWIDRNWMEPFDMDKLAEECSVSKNHLSKLFKHVLGLTPFQYYRRVRMENVREKLKDTRLSIRQAFEACGMKYNGSIAHEFKRMFSKSPGEFRKSL